MISKKIRFSVVFFLLLIILNSINIFPIETIDIKKFEKKADSLQGKEKVDYLNNLPDIFFINYENECLRFSTQALEISDKFNYKKGTAFALKNQGEVFFNEQQYDQSIEVYTKAKSIFQELNLRDEIANSLKYIGYSYYNKNNFDVALDIYQQARKIFEQTGNKKQIGRIDLLMAFICISKAEYNKAITHIKKAIAINEEIKDKEYLGLSFYYLGQTYHNFSNYDLALKYYQKSFDLLKDVDSTWKQWAQCNIALLYVNLDKNQEEALKLFNQCLKDWEKHENYYGIIMSLGGIGEAYYSLKNYQQCLTFLAKALKIAQEKNFPNSFGDIYRTMGRVYYDTGQNQTALDYFLKSLESWQKTPLTREILLTQNYIGKAYLKLRNYNKAFEYFSKSLHEAEKLKLKEIKKYNYQYLSELFLLQKDYKKSLEYYKLFHEIDKEIFSETSEKNITSMQIEFETEQKEKEIALLKSKNELMAKENKIKNLTIKQQKTMRNGAIIISILLILIFIQFLRKFSYLLMFWKKKNYIGQYRLTEKIATGGMGQVFKAHPVKNKTQTLAIKVLKEEFVNDEVFKKRFKNEAAIIDQINHPHIVKVIERGEYEGGFYIAMEYLTGKTLETILKDKKALDFDLIISILVQIVEVLVKVHQNNIIHRDLKPENIMLIETPANPHFVKLLDFGIARSTLQTRLTLAGNIVGTVRYMSPEQLQGSDDLSFASDIFSLGVIAYEMVTGTQAFADDLEKAALQIAKEEIPDPIFIRKDCPVSLNGLIKRMMSKQAQLRPTAREVLAELSRYMPAPAQP